MKQLDVNGTQLAYIERGEGEPVVLVHGTIGDHRSWPLQMDAFAQTHRTIAYSRRYHHPNRCNGDETDYSAALHADDLAAFISGLGLEPAHVVGFSYGAYTALFLAARHPRRVRTLVAAEPPILPLLEQHPEGRALRDEFLTNVWEPVGDVAQQGDMEAAIRMYVDRVVGEGSFDQIPPEIQDLIMDNACEFKVETASPDFWTRFTRQEAEQLTAPTLLLTGAESLRMFQLVVEVLARWLPSSVHVRVPDSNHDIPGGSPAAFNESVLDFLGGLAA